MLAQVLAHRRDAVRGAIAQAGHQPVGRDTAEDVAVLRAENTGAIADQAFRLGLGQGRRTDLGAGLKAARAEPIGDDGHQRLRAGAGASGPGEAAALRGGDVGEAGLDDRRGRLAAGMGEQHDRPRLVLADVEQARRQIQGIADSGLAKESDVVLQHLQGRRTPGREGLGHAQRPGQARQPLGGVGDIEAHIEVPHLVALPGVDPAPPDLDAPFEHGKNTSVSRALRACLEGLVFRLC